MAFVITQPCIGSKEASCVDVCPVDCIHPAPGERLYTRVEHLYINPNECIDCGACQPACPSSAIYHESAVPPQWGSSFEQTQITIDKLHQLTGLFT